MIVITPSWRASGRQWYGFLCLSGSLAIWTPTVHAQSTAPVEFNAGFLRHTSELAQGVSSAILNTLSEHQTLAAGRYRVDILVNLNPVGSRELDFSADDNQQLAPCLPAAMLAEFGVRAEGLADASLSNAACLDLARVIPGATVDFDSSTLQVALSVPQIAMRRGIAGSVDPARWDKGINAAFINYQASTLQGRHRRSGSTASSDLYLNTGINLGDWRLRSSQSWRDANDGEQQWTRTQTYAQRDIPGTRANLTLGETFLDSDVFRGIPVSGVRIASDIGMLPDVLQNYAPIIRGVAQTRAKLEVWQNGYPIYSTFVSPGPYAIDDLSTSGSGELEVVLTEDDGEVKRFTQPYSSIGNLMRRGVWRYSAAFARYNPASSLDKPWLAQGTLATGLAWNTTLYGGLMASEYYHAANLGVGRDFAELGALAFDVTHARAEVDANTGAQVQGLSYALKYGKAFITGTSLRFAGYRYSTEGYRDFDEAVSQRGREGLFLGSRRSRMEASVHQSLGKRHSLSLSLSQQDYWQHNDTQRQYQLGFNTHLAGVSWNLFASQSLSDARGKSRQLGLSLSMPLEFGRSTHVGYNVFSNANGYNQRASLRGNEKGYSYNASVGQDERYRNNAALTIIHQGPYASVSTGLTEASDYRNFSLNASGAVLLHGDGLLFGPYVGDTAAVVEVPAVAGVGVQNATAAQTNQDGYAMIPYLQPYRVNNLVLQTDQLGPEVEIDNGTAQVVPRRGAIVKQRFAARHVTRLVLTLHDAGGQPLPFGARLQDRDGQMLGLIGQGGRVMLSDVEQAQTLSVQWGDQADDSCEFDVDPQALDSTQGYRLQNLTCA
ncbi:fimbria/pilus outer membrane usher protein [Pseudomonas capeferrum]|uniref:fimbria/pilus outer membrane usher protein n=1 Tax=Pseudomonas TaxID=286 RepID=UPI0016483921|nr:fimbria/pilus outer membrane usher protein [Pseudomonas sp. SWRI77]MBC3479735.1 fimbrial biogenesis outer membrane usher protein [Pseudomonas sp. SWRI77]